MNWGTQTQTTGFCPWSPKFMSFSCQQLKNLGQGGQSQDGRPGGHGVHVSAWLGHLQSTGGGPQTPKGMEGTPSNQVRSGGNWRGRKSGDGTGLEPWRRGWGRGRVPMPIAGKGGIVGRAENQKGVWPAFPLPIWAPGSLLKSRAWSSAPWGPLQLRGSWGSGKESRQSKSQGRTVRTSPPGGQLWEGRSSHTQWEAYPRLGAQQWQGRCSGKRRNRREHGQHFSCPLGHQGACCAAGPNPPPTEAPSGHAEPKPHPHTLTWGLISKLQNSTLGGSPQSVLPFPTTGPKPRPPPPCLNDTRT